MKRFLCAVLVVLVMASCVYAADSLKIGVLTKLNVTQEDFEKLMQGLRLRKREYRTSPNPEGISYTYRFYDTLTAMLMALNSGEIDEIQIPEDVAKYVLSYNKSYEISAINVKAKDYLSLGFNDNEKGRKLQSLFNDALITMENDGRLAALTSLYVTDPGIDDEPEAIRFEHFDGAETISVAVTGDMPPIDFIAADGVPAGFNTAILAEAAKIMKVNVKLVNVDTIARAASLVSGHVDVVFWFQISSDPQEQNFDIPKGIILSEPYYSWDKMYSLKKK